MEVQGDERGIARILIAAHSGVAENTERGVESDQKKESKKSA